jgi:hypothetical protein
MSNLINNPNRIDKIQELLSTGNIDQFTPKERLEYIHRVCEASGLNPLTRPFDFIRFQGKTVLYASKGCADQLRKINNISIKVTERKIEEGILFVTVEGSDPNGRVDSDVGALNVTGLKGDALANAVMKGITKAKRRLTLSMCGLGIMDEMELESIPEEVKKGNIELKSQDEAFERIEKKEILAETESERNVLIESIKLNLGELTKGQKKEEKSQAMKDLCSINSWDEINKKSLKELDYIIENMKAYIQEKEKRELLKNKQETSAGKSAADNSFKIEP